MKKLFLLFTVLSFSVFLSAEFNLQKQMSFGIGYGPSYGNGKLGINTEIDFFQNQISFIFGQSLISRENDYCYNVGFKFYFNSLKNRFRPGFKASWGFVGLKEFTLHAEAKDIYQNGSLIHSRKVESVYYSYGVEHYGTILSFFEKTRLVNNLFLDFSIDYMFQTNYFYDIESFETEIEELEQKYYNLLKNVHVNVKDMGEYKKTEYINVSTDQFIANKLQFSIGLSYHF